MRRARGSGKTHSGEMVESRICGRLKLAHDMLMAGQLGEGKDVLLDIAVILLAYSLPQH